MLQFASVAQIRKCILDFCQIVSAVYRHSWWGSVAAGDKVKMRVWDYTLERKEEKLGLSPSRGRYQKRELERQLTVINTDPWELAVSHVMGTGICPCDLGVPCCATCLSLSGGSTSKGLVLSCCTLCDVLGSSVVSLCAKGMSLGSKFDWHFPHEIVWLTPTYPAEKREKSCEPLLAQDPLTGVFSSNHLFLKLLCPNAKCAHAKMSIYTYAHTFTQHIQFLAKTHQED